MKIIHKAGKRKSAIAKATLKPGKGLIRINKVPLEKYGNEISRMKIQEPLELSGSKNKYNIDIQVRGGGWMGQSDASRLAIARCLVEANPSLKKTFLEYDRQLLVADTRSTETSKPNDSKPRAKRQKSYR